MSAGCAACGDCCDPVIIEAGVFFGCAERARSQEFASANDRFITQHWHPVSAWKAEDGVQCISARCDMFDPDRRACTAYAGRPPVCGDYPWYGEKPGAERASCLPLRCSYAAALPPDHRRPDARPLIPLTVISAREAA